MKAFLKQVAAAFIGYFLCFTGGSVVMYSLLHNGFQKLLIITLLIICTGAYVGYGLKLAYALGKDACVSLFGWLY